MCNRLLTHSGLRYVPSLLHLATVRTLTSCKPKKTHYEILGLKSSATSKEIRHAFLKLSKQCHPDTSRNDPNTHKKFIVVKEAYTILSKPVTRRDYDASLMAACNVNTANSQSYAYGYHPESGHYTHYKGHRYDETDWGHKQQTRSDKSLTPFYAVTACLTCATVTIILHYVHNYMPDPKFKGLRKHVNSQEIEQHDLIMTSEHDGMMVYYYAVPKTDDPESYEVLAVKRNQIKDSDMHELQELNSVSSSK